MWKVDSRKTRGGVLIINVTPADEKHVNYIHCLCNPQVESTPGATLIIHNSFDGREAVEMAKAILRGEK